MTREPPGPTYRQAAWTWSRHLRDGGTRTWRQWSAEGRGADAEVPVGWSPPGTAPLAFARLLALRAEGAPRRGGSVADLAALVDLVLSRSGPGRGRAQQPLLWSSQDAGSQDGQPVSDDVAGAWRRSGAAAVDPADVPVDELVRVGVGTLTELVLRASSPLPRARAALLPRRPAFSLVGAPLTAAVVRRELAAAGHRAGPTAPRSVVLVEPLDVLLAQAWSARVQAGAPVRWRGFTERWTRRDALPPGVDLAAVARRRAAGLGGRPPGQVDVVVVGGQEDPVAAVGEVLGLPVQRLREAPPTGPLDLTPAALDLLRRVNAVLAVRAEPARRAATTRLLAGVLASMSASSEPRSGARPGASGPGPGVPSTCTAWVQERAARMAEDLAAGGYAVHGDLGLLVPRPGDRPSRVRPRDVLALVSDSCLAVAGGHDHLEGATSR